MSNNQITDPLPTAPPSVTPPHNNTHVAIQMSDLYIGGSLLLAICVIFIVFNALLSWLVFKNWFNIKKSRFFNSIYLGLVLSLADFALAALVGLPSSFHLTWVNYFREQAAMRYYSLYIAPFLFEYIFLFRVLIIALLSMDTFLHIKFPLRYDAFYESRIRVQVACLVAAIIPLLCRTTPSLVNLMHYSEQTLPMDCLEYNDPNASTSDELKNEGHYNTPLTCAVYLQKSTGSTLVQLVDVIILAIITAGSWVVIVLTNLIILVSVIRGLHDKSMKKIMKITLVISAIAFTFVLTNFPYVVAWWLEYLSLSSSDGSASNITPATHQQRFYLSLLSFLSLLFHPWIYVLRLKSFRDLLTGFKKKMARSFALRSSRNVTKISMNSLNSKRIGSDSEKAPDSPKSNNLVYRNEASFYQRETTSTNIAQVTTTVADCMD